jgi:GTP-binding protein
MEAPGLIAMKVRDVRHQRAASKKTDFPRDGRPQIAVMGRSNVGKSSLINRFFRRTDLARVSKTPGRTRQIHFYLVNEKYYFVDLPGFGYARISREMRKQWQGLIESYLDRRDTLRLAVHLIDARHDPTPLDVALRDMLGEKELPTAVVLTKADKLSRGQLSGQAERVRRLLELPEELPVLPVSARSGIGMRDFARLIDAALE